MHEIVCKLLHENNVNRLAYRLIRRFGPLDAELLAILVGIALLRAYPSRCSSIDNALLFLTLQYRTTLSNILGIVMSYDYIKAETIDNQLLYFAIR